MVHGMAKLRKRADISRAGLPVPTPRAEQPARSSSGAVPGPRSAVSVDLVRLLWPHRGDENGVARAMLVSLACVPFCCRAGKLEYPLVGFEFDTDRPLKHNMGVITLAGYSPDSMPLDYSIWRKIDDGLAAEEKTWDVDKTETIDEFKARLKRTALAVDSACIDKAMGSMKRRCMELGSNGGVWIKHE